MILAGFVAAACAVGADYFRLSPFTAALVGFIAGRVLLRLTGA